MKTMTCKSGSILSYAHEGFLCKVSHNPKAVNLPMIYQPLPVSEPTHAPGSAPWKRYTQAAFRLEMLVFHFDLS